MELTDVQRVALKNVYHKKRNSKLKYASINEKQIKEYESLFKILMNPSSEDDYFNAAKATIGQLDGIINSCEEADRDCKLIPLYSTSVELLIGAANAGMKGTPEFEKIESTVYQILSKNEEFMDAIKDPQIDLGHLIMGLTATASIPLIIYLSLVNNSALTGIAASMALLIAGLGLLGSTRQTLKNTD